MLACNFFTVEMVFLKTVYVLFFIELSSRRVRVAGPPIRPPRANAFAERWVGSARRECLDHLLVFGGRHLQRVLGAYADHYNRTRPHRGLNLEPPDPRASAEIAA